MNISWVGVDNLKERIIRLRISGPGRNELERWFSSLSTRDATKLCIFSYSVLRNGKLSYNCWSGYGKLYSRPAYKKLIEIFMVRGWVVWRDPEVKIQGVCLTALGQIELKNIIDLRAKKA